MDHLNLWYILGEDQPSGPGCWLGDVNDVNRRAWFSGDVKVIERCESYGINPVKLALSLTEALFTREEMAASNVRGTRGKETLDPAKIKAIRGKVAVAGVTPWVFDPGIQAGYLNIWIGCILRHC